MESGGLRVVPQGGGGGVFRSIKCIPNSNGFGRGSNLGGFGWIPGPRKWNPSTQPQLKLFCLRPHLRYPSKVLKLNGKGMIVRP